MPSRPAWKNQLEFIAGIIDTAAGSAQNPRSFGGSGVSVGHDLEIAADKLAALIPDLPRSRRETASTTVEMLRSRADFALTYSKLASASWWVQSVSGLASTTYGMIAPVDPEGQA